MKECFKCHETKPLTEFYKHPQMGDGHLNKCKECNKKDVSENYQKNRQYYAEYEKKRYQDPKRHSYCLRKNRKRRSIYPEKYRAISLLWSAVRGNRLEKQPCEVCGDKKVQAHHEDYSKPLDVNWLCRKHHLEKHGKQAYEFD